MLTINPYLSFDGTCEEAFELYKKTFGGDYSFLSRFSDVPEGEGMELADDEMDKIMHVALPIGENQLMGSDVPKSMGGAAAQSNTAISIQATSEAEADRLFAALSEGGQVLMPLEKTFWNAYYGMWVDRFGIRWMVNYEYPATADNT